MDHLLLFSGDEIEYRTSEGRVLSGKVLSISGSRIYLQDGGVVYESYVLRKLNK